MIEILICNIINPARKIINSEGIKTLFKSTNFSKA